MKENNPHIDQLICSFLDRTISKVDFDALKAWTYASEENQTYVRTHMEAKFTDDVLNDRTPFDVVSAINRFRHHVDFMQADDSSVRGIRVRMISKWTPWIAAAAVVLLVFLPWMAYHVGSNAVKRDFSQIVMEAPEGSQLNLTLPDGSTVRLNSGSSISYSQGFGITDRNINLQGEGYFTVKHDDKLRFTVSTRELVLNDLGTEFDFCNYKEDDEATVRLFEGKVSLDNRIQNSSGYELQPGERIVMNKHTGKMQKFATDLDKEMARLQSDLTFEDMCIADIARLLSRSYGVQIEVADSIANKRFYGSFNRKTDTLGKVLHTMSITQQIRFTKKNGKYILY